MAKSKNIQLTVNAKVTDFGSEIDLVSSLQALASNISVNNLKLLAEKSKKPGINQKISLYKNLI
jgi:hypothetical protein